MSKAKRGTKHWTSATAWAAKDSGKHHYSFEWEGGGYNDVCANSLAEAKAKARALGESTTSPYGKSTITTDTLIPVNVRLDKKHEHTRALDRAYSGMFD